jgi:hypothetical protein
MSGVPQGRKVQELWSYNIPVEGAGAGGTVEDGSAEVLHVCSQTHGRLLCRLSI